MTSTPVPASAASAREAARATDGKFGTQARAEADLDLLGHDPGQSTERRRAAATALVGRLRAQTEAAEAYADDLLIHEVALAIREENPQAKTLTLTSNEHDMLEVELDGEYDEYATEELSGSSIVERTRAYTGLVGHGLSTKWVKVHYDDYELKGTIDLEIATTDPIPPLTLVEAGSRPFTETERDRLSKVLDHTVDRLQDDSFRNWPNPAQLKGTDEVYALTMDRRPEETDTGHRVRAMVNRVFGPTRADRAEVASVWIPSRDTTDADGRSGVDLIGAYGTVSEGKIYGLTERIEGLEHLSAEELSASGIVDNGHGWHVPLG